MRRSAVRNMMIQGVMLAIVAGFAAAAGCNKASGVDDLKFVDCPPGVTITCGIGACSALRDACVNGRQTFCESAAGSAAAEDTCGDGLDNDCDGAVDENDSGGCTCGDVDAKGNRNVKACYTGSPGTRNRGVCHDGVQSCENSAWGQCSGSVLPEPEICDGLDNNCDGEIDEGCACTSGSMQLCYPGSEDTIGKGACSLGAQTCNDGKWGKCIGAVIRHLETCDDADLDCDGIPGNAPGCECVNGESHVCYTGSQNTMGVGACRGGSLICSNGKIATDCMGEITPQPEICNAIDDDCNGILDDNVPGVGDACAIDAFKDTPCFLGTLQCTSASTLEPQCVPNTPPGAEAELCDGIDNDCNGQVDDQCAPVNGDGL
jgi:hypothetical protein